MWICENCEYDQSADDSSFSHIPYSLFKNGLAVCDGYTGAYNLLLKLEGISCYTQAGSDHAWTVALLDGAEFHIDTTWGDSNGISVDFRYFAMPPEISYEYHPW
jgi:transglutaminase/protease-like cytokinesis protein 3